MDKKEINVGISYTNTDNDFMIEFSRVDRNIVPSGGMINGTNGTVTEDEASLFMIQNIFSVNIHDVASQMFPLNTSHISP